MRVNMSTVSRPPRQGKKSSNAQAIDTKKIEKLRRVGRHDAKAPRTILGVRISELQRLMRARFRHRLPDDERGRAHLLVLLNTKAAATSPANRIRSLMNAIEIWAPWMAPADAESAVTAIAAKPRQYKADTIADILQVTAAERDRHRLCTVGAIDMSKAERTARRKQRQRERNTTRRRAAGARSRADYVATAKVNTKPWLRMGMSRRTYYRHGWHKSECTDKILIVRSDLCHVPDLTKPFWKPANPPKLPGFRVEVNLGPRELAA
jgi:hypothetical protein